MLFDIFTEGFGLNTIMNLMARVFVVFCTLPIHEYAHAYVATKFGDDTPRLKGRLTLNPLAHLDVMGALMIFLVGFGYAKPVPVNPRRFKNLKTGLALTALAGPLSNIIMAIIFMLLANVFNVAMIYTNGLIVTQVAMLFFTFAAQINVSLAIFNLIPIPPLDGSKIISLFIPSKYYYKILQYERYIIIAVFALIVFGVLDIPLSFLTRYAMQGISWLTSLPFRFILG